MSDIECPGEENFLGLCPEYSRPDKSRFTIIPVPYDATSSYVSGSRRAPSAIIEASANVELYDHELGIEAAREGVFTADDVGPLTGEPASVVSRIESAVGKALDLGSLPVVLGGEHTVSLGAVKAVASRAEPYVVSLDAHADLRDKYGGTPLSHACFLRRALEVADGEVIGVRSLSKEESDYSRRKGVKITYAEEIHSKGNSAVDIHRIPRNLYLSIDLDVLDPSVMPATGTPEPGGLGWYDLIDLLRVVISGRKVLGFDVVELCPQPGNVAPDFTAARLIYKIMGIIIKYSANGGS